MKKNYRFLIIMALSFGLLSCGAPVVKVSPRDVLIQNIVENNKSAVLQNLPNAGLSTNVRNLIIQYFDMQENMNLKLVQSLLVTNNLVKQESAGFTKINQALNTWAFLQEIYRIEVAKDVRILQRDKLYLAPSNVNFNKCQNTKSSDCAINSRTQLNAFLNQEQITSELKLMAENDPCINLTIELQDDIKANQCLQKRMGEIDVLLISKPQFSFQDWKNVIN